MDDKACNPPYGVGGYEKLRLIYAIGVFTRCTASTAFLRMGWSMPAVAAIFPIFSCVMCPRLLRCLNEEAQTHGIMFTHVAFVAPRSRRRLSARPLSDQIGGLPYWKCQSRHNHGVRIVFRCLQPENELALFTASYALLASAQNKMTSPDATKALAALLDQKTYWFYIVRSWELAVEH